jgi:cytosine/adenosine deaminase-related metal-dependent hydrolase
VAEIATFPVLPIDRSEAFVGTAFRELLGLRDESHDTLFEGAKQFIRALCSIPCSQTGLSQHEQYTVSPKLLERVVRLSAGERLPVAMHLAETRDELELLSHGSGPLRELLGDLGAWQDDAIPLGSRPLNYLKLLATAHRSLVIHGNYLTDDEIEFAAQRRDQMSIVYCPRTHAYFGHEPYPLAELLRAGVRVAIGTDSRASNPDLSVLNELRFAALAHPRVTPREIMRTATIDAAIALGIGDRQGSLTVGKHADFVVLPIGDHEPLDPYELVLDSADLVTAVFRFGRQVGGDAVI